MKPNKFMFYLIGSPGSGKTTLLRTALAGIPYIQEKEGKVAYVRYPAGAELGVVRDGGYSGTDGLAMDVMPEAIEWLQGCPFTSVIAEGDRLASAKFFGAAKASGWQLTVAWLWCPEELAEERREERGSEQDPKWLRGRNTKIMNLVTGGFTDPNWVLNGEDSLDGLVRRVWGHPAVAQIVAGRLNGS